MIQIWRKGNWQGLEDDEFEAQIQLEIPGLKLNIRNELQVRPSYINSSVIYWILECREKNYKTQNIRNRLFKGFGWDKVNSLLLLWSQ